MGPEKFLVKSLLVISVRSYLLLLSQMCNQLGMRLQNVSSNLQEGTEPFTSCSLFSSSLPGWQTDKSLAATLLHSNTSPHSSMSCLLLSRPHQQCEMSDALYQVTCENRQEERLERHKNRYNAFGKRKVHLIFIQSNFFEI